MQETNTIALYQEFETYDFDNDPSFQAGLPSILGNTKGMTMTEQKSLLNKAKWFYYTKTKVHFDYDDYIKWKENGKSQDISVVSLSKDVSSKEISLEILESQPSYPKSFTDIVELIQSGKPIPGIKQIPNKINEETPTQTILKPKPKPWDSK